jgi:hypothetical protein
VFAHSFTTVSIYCRARPCVSPPNTGVTTVWLAGGVCRCHDPVDEAPRRAGAQVETVLGGSLRATRARGVSGRTLESH